MDFVYLSIVWYALWIAIPLEEYPFGLLTMIVSLEAIFLSTFILISQNRADERRQVVADHQWETVEAREAQIEQLMSIATEMFAADPRHPRANHVPGWGRRVVVRRGNATLPVMLSETGGSGGHSDLPRWHANDPGKRVGLPHDRPRVGRRVHGPRLHNEL